MGAVALSGALPEVRFGPDCFSLLDFKGKQIAEKEEIR
jgi:hypothetical protein